MPIFKNEKIMVETPFSGFTEESCHLDFTHKMISGDRKGYPAFQHNGNFQMLEGAREEHVDFLIDGVFKKGSVAVQYRNKPKECAVYKDPSEIYCQDYAEIFFKKMIGMMSIALFNNVDAINIKDISDIYVSHSKSKEDAYISAKIPSDLLCLIRERVDSNHKISMVNHVKYKYHDTIKDISNDYHAWEKDANETSSLQWKEIVDIFMMMEVMRYWQEAIGYSMFLKNEMPIEKF